jgi:hypothetical protein
MVASEGKLKTHARNVQYLHVTMAAKNNYAAVRFACAMALLRDGFGVTAQAANDTAGTGGNIPTYYDEFDAQLGAAIDPARSAPEVSGVYDRRYTNGRVLVNATGSDIVVDLTGFGYKFLTGTLDTAVNTGATITGTVTVPARGSHILVLS